MQRFLRKSIPFAPATLLGALAGLLVAGFAVFAAHS
jgi:hypothetical protein